MCAAVLQAGLTLDDIDVYEINEAFASQATYCVQKLGLDESKVRERGRTRCVLAFVASESPCQRAECSAGDC